MRLRLVLMSLDQWTIFAIPLPASNASPAGWPAFFRRGSGVTWQSTHTCAMALGSLNVFRRPIHLAGG